MSREDETESLTIQEAAELLGVTSAFLLESLRESGLLKRGREASTRIRAREVRDWLAQQRAGRDRDVKELLKAARELDDAAHE